MGAAYFIALDNPEAGFDTFVNGKAIARERDAICGITDELGLKGIDDLTSFGDLDAEFELPEEYRETETPWFEPQEGLEWIRAIRRHIELNKSSVKDAGSVLSELKEYETVLEKAAGITAKWHFEIDI